MADLFAGLYKIALIILIVILILGFVIAIGVFLYLYSRKKKRKTLKNIDYSSFMRRDAKSYIDDIDDITDDMIIMNGMTRFVGVIECQGFDFYEAHLVEQGNTVQNYLGFVNTIDKPISYRQHSKSVDLEFTLKKYFNAHENIREKLDKAIKRQNEIQATLKNKLSPERKNLYLSELELTKRSISALSFRLFHIEDQLQYIDNNSGSTSTPLISSNYVFDWVYNPMEYSVDLTDSEIIERAKNELAAQANAKINSLSNSGVRAKRCSTIELIDMCRRHSQPISSERFRIRDVISSSYYDDIVSTNDIDRINESVRNKLSKEATEKLNDDFNKMIEDIKFDGENKTNTVVLSAGRVEGGSK